MRGFTMRALVLLSLGLIVLSALAREPPPPPPEPPKGPATPPPAVIELFEDDAERLLAEMGTDGDDVGTASREDRDRFTGVCSMRVTPRQRFQPQVKGWNYAIKPRPKPGEFRFVRFAWKKVGDGGIMIQFCGNTDATGWEHRYLSGPAAVSWATREVADKPPADWTLVTCDLIRDFGLFTLTGIAFTPMNGTAGLYDHVYLGRTVADLDRATDLARGKVELKEALSDKRLDELWTALLSEDALVHLEAAALLAKGARQSVPYLRGKLYQGPGEDHEKTVARLVVQLDDDDFAVRQKAQKELSKLGPEAIPLLQRALQKAESVEVRTRLEQLLEGRGVIDNRAPPDLKRLVRAIRALELAATPEARKVMEELASSKMDDSLKADARAAVKRMATKEP